MQDFVYERPETIGEAIAAMRADDARALAGGTDLVPQLREGRRRAACIVDLKHVPEMTAITVLPDGGVSIGAAATATAVARHAADRGRLPGRCAVRAAHWRRASPEPREPGREHLQCGAVGGRRAGADLPWGAGRDRRPRGNARNAGRGDLRGAGPHHARTRRAHGGDPAAAGRAPRRRGLSALHAATGDGYRDRRGGAWLRLGEDGTIAEARLALASVAPTPIRAPRAEQRLLGERPSGALFEEAGRLAAQDARPISDTRGSAGYRGTLVAVLTARALADCGRRLGLEVAVA